jgi:hypothetical protein
VTVDFGVCQSSSEQLYLENLCIDIDYKLELIYHIYQISGSAIIWKNDFQSRVKSIGARVTYSPQSRSSADSNRTTSNTSLTSHLDAHEVVTTFRNPQI